MTRRRIANLRRVPGSGRARRQGGNELYVDETPGDEAFLKVYRRRGPLHREILKRLSYRFVERKRGVTARERCALEREHLALWRREGFDVPRLLDRPLPEGLDPSTAFWMEYRPGTLLSELVRDPEVERARRLEQVQRFASTLGERQARAIERSARGLVMKHASIKHVILCGDRQVTFDLEGTYAPSFPVLDALADELASSLRSLLRVVVPDERDVFGEAFLEAYARTDRMAEIADFGLRRGGLHRAVRRRADRRRRDSSEYDMLVYVEAWLSRRA